MEKTRLSQSIYSDLIQDFMNSGVNGSIIRDLIMQRNIMPNRGFIGGNINQIIWQVFLEGGTEMKSHLSLDGS